MNIPVSSLLDFTGRTVLVTGAGKGIGAGIARRFAEAGADIVLSYRSSAGAAWALAKEIETAGGKAIAVEADVTRAAAVERLVERAIEVFGRIDVAVNNAGVYPTAPLLEMTEEDWNESLDANLKSVFLVTRAVGRHMASRREGGAIVNIASIEGAHPAPHHSHYSAAKAAVLMHTRAAALELGPRGIRVNAVSPGLVERPEIAEEWPEGVERWRAAAPLERLGRPEDVADACLFLASPAARWITGAELRVDGGISAGPIF